MTTDNAAVVRRLVDEVVNGGKLEVIDELVTNDYVYLDNALGRFKGPGALKAIIGQSRQSFPDTVWTIEEQVSDGDTVASRFTWTATHTKDFDILPVSGKTMSVTVVSFDDFTNGRMRQTRMFRDDLRLLRQLGFVPEREDLREEILQRG